MISAYPETIPGHLRDYFGVRADNRVFDTVLMGRSTYEVGLRDGVTSPYPHLRQYVFSRSMKASPHPDVTLVNGDPLVEVRRLKARDSNPEAEMGIWLCGGGRLAAALHSEIDELVLKIHPVAIGTGIPLFDGPVGPMHFELSELRSYPDGFVRASYARSARR